MANWVRHPSPFSQRFPLGEHAKWRCDTPPQKGYLSDTGAIPYENKANGCDTPLCDTISKGYCAIWGGVSRIGPLSSSPRFLKRNFLCHADFLLPGETRQRYPHYCRDIHDELWLLHGKEPFQVNPSKYKRQDIDQTRPALSLP